LSTAASKCLREAAALASPILLGLCVLFLIIVIQYFIEPIMRVEITLDERATGRSAVMSEMAQRHAHIENVRY
jgi:hypothetical protein